jgi:transcriptional regulator with XRE-family HTH domain
MTTHSLKERLEKQMTLKGFSVPQLEKRAGVKRNVARNMLEGKSTRPHAHNLEAIARALECNPQDLMPDYKPVPSQRIVPLKLFEAVTRVVLEELRKKNHPSPPLERLLELIRESALYSAQKTPPTVDKDFIAWLINKG